MSRFLKLPFKLGGVNYVGDSSRNGGGSFYLNYEGHPGYDYAAKYVPVYAASSSIVFYPWNAVGSGGPASTADKYDTYCRFHTLAEIPDIAPAYRIYYLHLATHPAVLNSPTIPYCNLGPDTSGETLSFSASSGCYTLNGNSIMPSTLPLPEGTHVNAGCQIAVSGKAGVPGAHLHFEVQRIVPASALKSEKGSIDYFHCWNENMQYASQEATAYCLPADPYGWTSPDVADTWGQLTGVPSQQFWQP